MGILVPGATEWSFLHQTFFDYCYAKRFVEKGKSLSETVLGGDQGLLARPQLLHVLSYLRGSGDGAYLKEVQSLLRDGGLRVHLKLLLLGWFGSLGAPTDDEWLLARRMIADPAIRGRFLVAMQGNRGWFARMKEEQIQNLLAEAEEVIDSQVVPYLTSMVDVEQAVAVELVGPLAERGKRWERRVRLMLARIRDWNAVEAVRLFEAMLRRVPISQLGRVHELGDVVKAFPREGCRLVRVVFDRTLEGDDWPYFAWDLLCRGWSGGIDRPQESLMRAMVSALSEIARAEPEKFRRLAERLGGMHHQTPQQLLAHVYCRVPAYYADDALRFLVGDTRRLELGERERYDTRQLIGAIHLFLSPHQRVELEAFILSYNPILAYLGVAGLKDRGLEQMYLLQSMPSERLSERGANRLRELERKFPNRRASEDPPAIFRIANDVGSPIPKEAASKLSDAAWLTAMGKYRGITKRRKSRRGGAAPLGGVMTARVKEEPQRFHRLALEAPPDVDASYVRAFIDGLADSAGPDEWLFDVVERFAGQNDREMTRTIAWALEKRADGGLNDEMLDLLERAARDPAGDDEDMRKSSGHGPHGVYINSDRGASLKTLMNALRARETAEAKIRTWDLLEFASADRSTALRSGAIEELLYLLHEDRERAITLFLTTMDGHSELLLCSFPVPDFLHYGAYKHFSRMQPFIEIMLDGHDEECQQRGAVLACVAAISSATVLGSEAALEAARELARRATNGSAALRRGAARVYAHNLDVERSACCARELSAFLDDDDDRVRDFAAEAFRHIDGATTPVVRRFVEAFAASRALRSGSDEFSEYLLEHGPEDPEWALSMLQAVLDNSHDEEPYSSAGGKLVRLALRLYTDPTADQQLRTRAMGVFDGLMERHTYEAQTALAQWDRR